MRDSVARNAPAPSPAPSRSFGFGSQAMQQDIGSATGGDFALAFQRESESMSSFSYAADSCQIDPCFTGEMADDWQPSSSVDTSHFDGFTYQPGTNSILPSLLSTILANTRVQLRWRRDRSAKVVVLALEEAEVEALREVASLMPSALVAPMPVDTSDASPVPSRSRRSESRWRACRRPNSNSNSNNNSNSSNNNNSNSNNNYDSIPATP